MDDKNVTYIGHDCSDMIFSQRDKSIGSNEWIAWVVWDTGHQGITFCAKTEQAAIDSARDFYERWRVARAISLNSAIEFLWQHQDI